MRQACADASKMLLPFAGLSKTAVSASAVTSVMQGRGGTEALVDGATAGSTRL